MHSNNREFSRVYDTFKYLYKKVWKLIEGTPYVNHKGGMSLNKKKKKKKKKQQQKTINLRHQY